MQKINCPGCYCSTPGLCAVYTVRACPSTTPAYSWNPGAGVLVRIRASAGGAIVAEGATDADGKVTLCVPTSALRYVEVRGCPRMADANFASFLTNATDRTLTLSGPAPGWCCPPAAIRNVSICNPTSWGPIPYLYLTDALGTRAANGGGCSINNWGVRPFAAPNVWACNPPPPVGDPVFGGLGYRRSIGPGFTNVSYTLDVVSGVWRLRRFWGALTTGLHTNPDVNNATTPATAYPRSTTSPGDDCGSPGDACYAEATFGPIDCENFYWSGSLSFVSGGLSDPMGGTVVLSG